ncbi:MAG: hypothetical protein ABGZ31_02420, partial [Roseibacillus sp.]
WPVLKQVRRFDIVFRAYSGKEDLLKSVLGTPSALNQARLDSSDCGSIMSGQRSAVFPAFSIVR